MRSEANPTPPGQRSARRAGSFRNWGLTSGCSGPFRSWRVKAHDEAIREDRKCPLEVPCRACGAPKPGEAGQGEKGRAEQGWSDAIGDRIVDPFPRASVAASSKV